MENLFLCGKITVKGCFKGVQKGSAKAVEMLKNVAGCCGLSAPAHVCQVLTGHSENRPYPQTEQKVAQISISDETGSFPQEL